MSTGPGYNEVAYDASRHGIRCRCGLDLTQLDGGAPAISVCVDDETGEVTCGEVCAVEAVAERRAFEDAEAGRHTLLKETA